MQTTMTDVRMRVYSTKSRAISEARTSRLYTVKKTQHARRRIWCVTLFRLFQLLSRCMMGIGSRHVCAGVVLRSNYLY